MAVRRTSLRELRTIKAHARRRLGTVAGVEGFGVGEGRLRVYVRDRTVRQHLPATFEGVEVECVEVGDIEAQTG